MLTRATVIGVALVLLGARCAANAQANPRRPGRIQRGAAKEWPAYAGTYAAARYSPLTQIDRGNAKDLHISWRWKSPDQAIKDAVGRSQLCQ
jgi:quinoprotein glucose dehydrogenase